jgi:hypothetical protein
VVLGSSLAGNSTAGQYRNFAVAVYARAYEVQQMKDLAWLEARFKLIERQLKVDRVYLETHRDGLVADEQTIVGARKFFEARGIQVVGGITLTVDESNRFETFCYTNPEHRRRVREVARYTARLFDELILDDFVFTNCKCEGCIQAKGARSWTDFRLQLMRQSMQELVIDAARAVNPKVKLVIKYPNWYEHYQGLGYDLEQEPRMFDGIYTGTETRQPVYNHQHLQQYLGYQIMRYLENVAPGRNGGGWVDTGAMRNADRYAEQLWLTLFAKARQVVLFDFRQLLRPLSLSERAPWQGQGTSFDFDSVTAPFRSGDGSLSPDLTVARVAGATFDGVDRFLGRLGTPVGVKAYKPYHSTGEDFLHDYLGMVGIPVDLRPEFPADAGTILLTESAAFDPGLVDKIKRQLRGGKTVFVTSGLLHALEKRGIRDIVEVRRAEEKVRTNEFYRFTSVFRSDAPIALPRIEYLTNDAWELIGADANGYPLLLQAGYAKGSLNVIAIPDNFADLYKLPSEVLDALRAAITREMPLRLEGPAQVSLFAYDNGTFIVESFRDEPVTVRVVTREKTNGIRDLLSEEPVSGQARPATRWDPVPSTAYEVRIPPHSYRVLTLVPQP